MADLSNKELLDMIKAMSDKSEERTTSLIESLREEITKDIKLAIIIAHEETEKMINRSLPDDHDSDHVTVKMIKGWGTSFFQGLFGSAGKIVFFAILIGIGVQIFAKGESDLAHSVISVLSTQ